MPIERFTIYQFVDLKAAEISRDVEDADSAHDCLMTMAFDKFGTDDRLEAVVSQVVSEYF